MAQRPHMAEIVDWFRDPAHTRAIEACPLCGGAPEPEHENAWTRLDRCTGCTHVYSRRAPGRRILSRMYAGRGYWVHDREHQGIDRVGPGNQWDGFLAARLGALERAGLLAGSALRFYEIGCSEGALLAELRRRGHQVAGCEANEDVAGMGRAAYDLDIDARPFETIPLVPASVDRVISFHTFEHLVDPEGALARAAALLTDDGQVLLEVPTGPEEYGNIDHLHFFEEASLEGMLGRHFRDTSLLENGYRNGAGTLIGSLYGIGRVPRRPR